MPQRQRNRSRDSLRDPTGGQLSRYPPCRRDHALGILRRATNTPVATTLAATSAGQSAQESSSVPQASSSRRTSVVNPPTTRRGLDDHGDVVGHDSENAGVPRVPGPAPTISKITRRDIFDFISLEDIDWHGRLDEIAFLSRIWDLGDMPSTDRRFRDAAGDISQHRYANDDWPDDWIFGDARFDLMHGPDSILLRFLSETVHPAVRHDAEEVKRLVRVFNDKLAGDG